jgi:hypothetical protein
LGNLGEAQADVLQLDYDHQIETAPAFGNRPRYLGSVAR